MPAAVASHHVQPGYLIPLQLVVEAGVGDDFSADGSNDGVVVGTLTFGERLDRAIRDSDLIDLCVERIILAVRMPIAADEQCLAVRHPGGNADVFVRPRRELPGRAAISWQNKQVVMALLKIALAVQ